MCDYALDTIDYRGYTIKVYQDELAESPREWDNLGTMLCIHSRYDLGDSHELDVEGILNLIGKPDIISLPLYLYDHSGISMSTNRAYPFNCPWDSGQVGYIYVDKPTLRKEYSVKRVTKPIIDKAITVLVGEVDAYSKYISGQVYGYNIFNPQGEHLDGCWGFYDTDDLTRECEGIIDYDIQQAELERAEMTLVEVGA